MAWLHWCRRHLMPPPVVCVLLLPCSAAVLVYAMRHLAETSCLRIGAYLLAFYTLCIWCLRAPAAIGTLVRFRRENPYARRYLDDLRWRVNAALLGSVVWNGAYAALQLGLGICHASAWFYFLAAYYGLLALMRFFLVRHTLRHRPGERMLQELRRCRACGWILLLMNLALSGMVLYRIRENRVMPLHEITTIALAAYTFTALVLAVYHVRRYRRSGSPAFSASAAVSLAAALVSMLSLEHTMLTTFDTGTMTVQTQRLFLALTGGGISVLIVIMALCMLVQSGKRINDLEKTYGTEGNL